MKESPRWLIAKGRFDEAEVIILDIAKVNKAKAPEPLFDEREKVEVRYYHILCVSKSKTINETKTQRNIFRSL